MFTLVQLFSWWFHALDKVVTVFGTDPLPAWIFYNKNNPEVFKLMDLLFTLYCFLQQPWTLKNVRVIVALKCLDLF